MDLNTTSDDAMQIQDDVANLDQQILLYVFQTTLHQPRHLMRSMIQLDTIDKQLSLMRHMVIEQVQRLHPDNPWRAVKIKLGNSSVLRSNCYLPRLHHSTQPVLEYQRLMRDVPASKRIPMKLHFKLKKAERLQYNNTGKLQHYILPMARKHPWMAEKLLYYKDNTKRKKLIDWRRGLSLRNRKCIACNNSFNRRHLTDCDYQLLVPPSLYNENLHAHWMNELETVIEDNTSHKWLKPDENIQYTIIDSLLNNSLFNLAHEWIKWLEDNLPTNNQLPATTS
jgi:hypothetical protein